MLLSEMDSIVAKIEELYCQGKRLLIAISGPPGAGKSTISEGLCSRLNDLGYKARIVPMDGFHLDNETLDGMGLRHRKGAPQTFDATGFVDLVRKLRANKGAISIPGFDRKADRVVPDASQVDTDQEILLIEGNYLLLNTPPWDSLAENFDLTIFINPGIAELERRLIKRWLENDHNLEDATKRARSNDIPNAATVISNSLAADIILSDDA